MTREQPKDTILQHHLYVIRPCKYFTIHLPLNTILRSIFMMSFEFKANSLEPQRNKTHMHYNASAPVYENPKTLSTCTGQPPVWVDVTMALSKSLRFNNGSNVHV